MQQKFESLKRQFSSGPEAGAIAWKALQDLAQEGFSPAQLFVAAQKLKSPPPLYDLAGALELLETLTDEANTALDRASRATSHFLLGEALLCHLPEYLPEGANQLESAAKLGHVEAQMDLAYCYRRGIGLSGNIQSSIHWLRQAAQQGHPRAMFELGIQLASATDSSGNIKEARAALDRAASYNYPAAAGTAQQLASTGKLTLPESNHESLSGMPDIDVYHGLLDPMECSHMAAMAMPHLKPSKVISDQRGGVADSARSSEGMTFHPGLRDTVITSIIRRLCSVAGCEFSQTESPAMLMYIPGAQYRVHPDFFPVDTEGGQRLLSNGGQRIKTMICYLNQVAGGGETEFPHLDIKVKPEAGSVLCFENTDQSGQPFPSSLHAGLPVTNGIKWISTLWIRRHAHEQWTA